MNYKITFLNFLAISLVFFGVQSCSNEKTKEVPFYETALNHAEIKMNQLVAAAEEKNKNPRNSTKEGKVRWLGESYDWTEGFFPGSLWILYDATGNEMWKLKAQKFQSLFESHKGSKNDHDMGFIFNCSYGNAYKLTDTEAFRNVFLKAANSLMLSYNPKMELIMSWDVNQKWIQDLKWQYPVIIDNMMNLELLFEASNYSGDSMYKEAAIAHANKTLQNHFRKDFSSYHVVDYDSISGNVRSKETNQGYAHETAWARGQAWGLYGYTMSYRYTKDKKYLEQAKRIANFYMTHKNLPEDKVPYWDHDAPNIPNARRDASAAAITASALIELNGYVVGDDYLNFATKILKSLATKYTNSKDDKSLFVLKESVGNYPKNSEMSVSISYADYYYIEALLRLKKLKKTN